MSADTITGFVGIVVQPDAVTIVEAYELAAALLPEDAEQVLTPGALPHVTLTQCAVRDAPRARLKTLIARLDGLLAGRALPLKSVVPFPGGFLFWCVDPAAPERELIQSAHEHALTLADGVLDEVANEAVIAGTARATGNDRRLVDNARRFGYAFIKDRYLPHITLGFDPRTVPSFAPQDRPHRMTIERVVLARLGRLGRVETILAL